eukprot:s5033_g4.t1
MTVNVQTLAQDPSSEAASDNDGFTGRAAFLREQCRYHGVNILALQETRTKKFDTFNSHSHIRLCSGCDSHGHHGVELWFDKHLALSTCVADPIRVQLSDLLVLFADPRTLLVRFTRRGLFHEDDCHDEDGLSHDEEGLFSHDEEGLFSHDDAAGLFSHEEDDQPLGRLSHDDEDGRLFSQEDLQDEEGLFSQEEEDGSLSHWPSAAWPS